MPNDRRKHKDALFEGFAVVGKALSSGRRVEILELLAQGDRSVEAVADEIDQSVANTSHHLRVLAAAGLVRTHRDGTKIIYRVTSDRVVELCHAFRDVGAAHLDAIDRLADAYLGDRSQLETVSREELAKRLKRGEVVVIDVRPSDEYEAGHIAGALSFPPHRVSRLLATLPKDADVVAYCRGPYCVFADDAVRTLQRKGFRSSRLEDGFPEWRAAGLPVVVGTEAR
jgi:rhodanese-related sulfurtransferase/predicted transcriptional regulator